jgi:tRNA (cytidine56-2'-O)-methyltransferase
MSVYVFRLGHRPKRDERVTTHLMLVARAFGASGAYYSGVRDPSMEGSIRRVCEDWGGRFTLEYAPDWRGALKGWRERGRVIHLTMYGLPLMEVMPPIRADPAPKLVVVGGAKVPGEVFKLADWNVSVTSQPHSEVSALAVFLHELFEGKELSLTFEGARLQIIPQARGKMVKALRPKGPRESPTGDEAGEALQASKSGR